MNAAVLEKIAIYAAVQLVVAAFAYWKSKPKPKPEVNHETVSDPGRNGHAVYPAPGEPD